MEFVMIVEPDEVGRKRLEAVFQTEKPSFSYQITGRVRHPMVATSCS